MYVKKTAYQGELASYFRAEFKEFACDLRRHLTVTYQLAAAIS